MVRGEPWPLGCHGCNQSFALLGLSDGQEGHLLRRQRGGGHLVLGPGFGPSGRARPWAAGEAFPAGAAASTIPVAHLPVSF